MEKIASNLKKCVAMINLIKNQLDKINGNNINIMLDKLKKYLQSTIETILDK